MPKLLIVPGSLRAASSARATAQALVRRLGDRAECTTADIGTLPLYNADLTDDPAVAGFIASVAAADGVVFVTPEYNYSVPGVLKNAIDWASRPSYQSVFVGKPCFVMSVSGGALGGVRALGHLRIVLGAMLAEVFTCQDIVVPMANTKVTDGELTDAAALAFAEERLHQFLARL
jgi:chromate reductase